MARLFWIVVGGLIFLWLLRSTGVLHAVPMVKSMVDSILGLACAFACPLFFLMMFYAPGLFRDLTGGVTRVWERYGARQRELEDLKRKIAHLDKAHHMAQLGNHYLRQGRHARAREWFTKALEKDPKLLDARYKLALCEYEEKDYQRACQLLEEVHQEKPDHDYGMAYLRLAQCHQHLGSPQRADEVFKILLQFYPGQPEGTYCYALLKSAEGDSARAHELMREVVTAVRLSPRFQRRRNRHWLLKAKWWLWRN